MKHSGKLVEIRVEGGARSGQEIKKHKLQHRKIMCKNILNKTGNKAIIYSNFKWTIIYKNYNITYYVVQSLSHVQLFVIPWTATCQASLSFIISQSLLKLMSMLSHVTTQPSHPLSPLSLAFNIPQHQGIFQ